MAIHIHSMTHAPEKAPALQGLAPTFGQTKSTSKAALSFSALIASSTREPSIAVTSPATTSAPSATKSTTSASASSSTSATSTGASASTASASISDDSNDGPAGPLFGAQPWIADPTGGGPGPVTHYSQYYFATPQTAQTVATMLGGTVVQANEMITSPASPFYQNQPNLMVQLPNGGLVNPGLIATFFTHNWPTSFVNQQIANEVAGATPASTST